jgi:hypothetical protein
MAAARDKGVRIRVMRGAHLVSIEDLSMAEEIKFQQRLFRVRVRVRASGDKTIVRVGIFFPAYSGEVLFRSVECESVKSNC